MTNMTELNNIVLLLSWELFSAQGVSALELYICSSGLVIINEGLLTKCTFPTLLCDRAALILGVIISDLQISSFFLLHGTYM